MKKHKSIKIALLSILSILIGITILYAVIFEKRGRSDITVSKLCETYHLKLQDINQSQISKVQGFLKQPYYEITLSFDDYYMIFKIGGSESDLEDKNVTDSKTLTLPAGDIELHRVNVAGEGVEIFNYFNLENSDSHFHGFLVKPQDEDKKFNETNFKEVSIIFESIFND